MDCHLGGPYIQIDCGSSSQRGTNVLRSVGAHDISGDLLQIRVGDWDSSRRVLGQLRVEGHKEAGPCRFLETRLRAGARSRPRHVPLSVIRELTGERQRNRADYRRRVA